MTHLQSEADHQNQKEILLLENNLQPLKLFMQNAGVQNFEMMQKTEDGRQLIISLVFAEKYIQEVKNSLIDIQTGFTSMNQGWSETLARFFYELKQQNSKRVKLTTLFQVIVDEIITIKNQDA